MVDFARCGSRLVDQVSCGHKFVGLNPASAGNKEKIVGKIVEDLVSSSRAMVEL
jgi:hypothetical protein